MTKPLPPWDPVDVVGAAEGDPAAWSRLARTWGPTVLRWCSFLGGPRVDAEDAAQQVFVIVWRKLPGLRSPERFPSWIFGITRRVLSDQRRSAWARRWLPGVQPERQDLGSSPERRASQSELSERVSQALDRLSADHRELLILCDLQGFSLLEAADTAGIGLNTAKSRLIRARSRFAEVARAMGLDLSGAEEPVEEPARGSVGLAKERRP
ncbi:MAG: RNA polymerase sigma factor [Pseudomonadota bacterium]